jgi:hypothetical protein
MAVPQLLDRRVLTSTNARVLPFRMIRSRSCRPSLKRCASTDQPQEVRKAMAICSPRNPRSWRSSSHSAVGMNRRVRDMAHDSCGSLRGDIRLLRNGAGNCAGGEAGKRGAGKLQHSHVIHRSAERRNDSGASLSSRFPAYPQYSSSWSKPISTSRGLLPSGGPSIPA